jgi:hypothetical protein
VELPDAISPLLDDHDRHQLYATIGSGDSSTGIETALQTMRHQSWPLPHALISKLNDWLYAYTHSDDAPRLHELIRSIESLD